MTNLRESLEEAERLCGERIEAMVVGQHYNARYDVPLGKDENVLLSREDGLAKVNQEYDSGFGGADCFPLYAWTETRVYFVHEYDGATGLSWLPRNPRDAKPSFGGNDGFDDFMEQREKESAQR